MDEALKTAFTSVLASPPGATSSGARLGYATLHRDVYAAANRGEEEVHALAALFHSAAASSLRSFLVTLPAPQVRVVPLLPSPPPPSCASPCEMGL
jgi:hypothetical protein